MAIIKGGNQRDSGGLPGGGSLWGKDTEPASLMTCSTMVMEVRGCSAPSTTASHVFLISRSRLFSATPGESRGGVGLGSSPLPYAPLKPLERACSLSPGWLPPTRPCHLQHPAREPPGVGKPQSSHIPWLLLRPISVGPAPRSEADRVKDGKKKKGGQRHRGKKRLEAKRNVTETQEQRLRGRVGERDSNS